MLIWCANTQICGNLGDCARILEVALLFSAEAVTLSVVGVAGRRQGWRLFGACPVDASVFSMTVVYSKSLTHTWVLLQHAPI